MKIILNDLDRLVLESELYPLIKFVNNTTIYEIKHNFEIINNYFVIGLKDKIFLFTKDKIKDCIKEDKMVLFLKVNNNNLTYSNDFNYLLKKSFKECMEYLKREKSKKIR